MSCSSHIPENDQKGACKKIYNTTYYVENKERIQLGKNIDEQRTSRFSKPDVKDGMKVTRNDSSAAREPIVNRTMNTSEITEDNTVKTTGNGSTNIGKVITPRIRNRSIRLPSQRQRKIGARDQES